MMQDRTLFVDARFVRVKPITDPRAYTLGLYRAQKTQPKQNALFVYRLANLN